MNGYIKLHKRILNWEWYLKPNTRAVMVHLLLLASYRKCKWRGRDIEIGSVVTSRKSLSNGLNLSEREIRTALSDLQATSELTIQTTNRYSVINIVNWPKYQGDKKETTSQTTSQTTTSEEVEEDKKERVESVKTSSTPFKGNMNIYDENKFSDEYGTSLIDKNGNPVARFHKKAKELDPTRLQAEDFLKFYMAEYKKQGLGEVPYWPKPAYLKQVRPVLVKYGLDKLKKLLGNYFYQEDKLFKDNKYSISCFLSWKILNQLDD